MNTNEYRIIDLSKEGLDPNITYGIPQAIRENENAPVITVYNVEKHNLKNGQSFEKLSFNSEGFSYYLDALARQLLDNPSSHYEPSALSNLYFVTEGLIRDGKNTRLRGEDSSSFGVHITYNGNNYSIIIKDENRKTLLTAAKAIRDFSIAESQKAREAIAESYNKDYVSIVRGDV